jgi:hypothetical protein
VRAAREETRRLAEEVRQLAEQARAEAERGAARQRRAIAKKRRRLRWVPCVRSALAERCAPGRAVGLPPPSYAAARLGLGGCSAMGLIRAARPRGTALH